MKTNKNSTPRNYAVLIGLALAAAVLSVVVVVTWLSADFPMSISH